VLATSPVSTPRPTRRAPSRRIIPLAVDAAAAAHRPARIGVRHPAVAVSEDVRYGWTAAGASIVRRADLNLMHPCEWASGTR